jgi:hypothetical protein
MGNYNLHDLLTEAEKSKLHTIKEHIIEIFKKGTIFHPSYTLHGVDHSEAVIEKLDKLTKNLMGSSHKLNSCEVFCILAAAYLHDTGMLLTKNDDETRVDHMRKTGQVQETYRISDLIREEHHIRSEEYIRNHKKELGLNHVEVEIIGRICRGHRKEDLKDEYYGEDVIGGSSVRVRLLAALLRLADELDIDFRRAPRHLREILEMKMSSLDKVHWIKHYCTKGVKFDEKIESGLTIITIKPHLMVPDEEYGKKYIYPQIIDPIKRKLDPSAGTDYVGDILAEYGVVIRLEEPRMDIVNDLEIIPPEIFEEARIQPKQQEIYQELLKIDKKAAQAYAGALAVLEIRRNSDRFSQSAHSLREVTGIISRKIIKPQETDEKNEALKQKLKKHITGKPYLLPPPAGKEVAAFIKRWDDLNRYFLSVAHHGIIVDEEVFFSNLSEFEAILLYFLKPNPVILRELDSLLCIQSPKQVNIKKLEKLLNHWTHVEYFFLNLSSPAWLRPLQENDFFSNPPRSIKEGDYIMFPVWPQSRYLVKIAEQKPREVMDIIKNMQETDNFRVHLDFIDCAFQIPSSIAKEIVSLARNWVRSPHTAFVPEKLGELVIKLCNDHELKPGMNLLSALLDIKGPDKDTLSIREAQPYFTSWEYEQILQKVVPVVLQETSCEVVEILCQKLFNAINLEGKIGKDPFYDLSNIWRHAIEDHSLDKYRRGAKNLLVTAIRDSLEKMGRDDEKKFKKCYELLSKYDFLIFRRIELHLMRLSPELFEGEIQDILSQRKFFDDEHLWHEYYQLLRDQYSKLPQHIKDKILQWIEEGPDLKEFESHFERQKKELPTQDLKDAYKAHWQMRYLSAIENLIPPKWKEKWDRFITKYGEPERPDFSSYIETGYGGPWSPLTKEEIKEKTPQELVAYLRTRKLSGDILAPSREGLGRALSDIMSENPQNYTGISCEFKTLHPIYIFHIISGFREAIKKENSFDWESLIISCKDILSVSETSKIRDDQTGYDIWKSVKKAIADLLEEGLRNDVFSPPFTLRETIWEIIENVLQDDEPDLHYEEKYGGENMDPVTLSINTVRGKAMHALIYYAVWCAHNLDLPTDENRIVPEVKKQLERMLDFEYEPTRTIRAVFGLYFPTLFSLNKEWAKDHIPSIFPEDAQYRQLWRAAWEGYLVPSNFYDDVYLTIRSQYEIAVNKFDSPQISTEAKKKLSEHLMIAYLKGLEKLEDNSLTEAFFERAQPEIRGHAIWFIGKELERLPGIKISRKEKERIFERIMNLWKNRIDKVEEKDNLARKRCIPELKWFGTWFIHNPFDKTWAITQLYTTLKFTGGDVEFSDDVIDRLQGYVEEDYLKVLKTLILLVKGDEEGWLLIKSKEKIMELVQFIFAEYPHHKIKSDMNELVDWLTRKGYYEFSNFFID